MIEPGTYDEQLIVRGDVSLVARTPGTVTIRAAAGQVLDSDGAVRLSGLRFEADAGEVIVCRGGSLVAHDIDVETRGHITLWAAPGTLVEARDSTFRGGRVLFAGASGTVESSELFDSADNAIAAIEGARLDVRDCRIERPRHSAVRVEAGSSVTIRAGHFASSHDTMVAVIGAAARAEIDGTSIEDAGTAIGFAEGATGSVRNVTVRHARHAFSSRSGANPTVSDSAFLDCVETGIDISERGAGTFKNCVIRDTGSVGVNIVGDGAAVGQWGTVDVRGCTIEGASVGIALLGAEGRFRDCRLSRLRFAGVRLLGASAATFDELTLTQTPVGLDVRGTSTGTFTRAKLGECRPLAVSAAEEARIVIAESALTDSGAGAGIQGSASLVMKDSELRDLESFGVVVMAAATLVLEDSRLLGPGAIGVIGIHDAFVDVRDTTVKDAADIGFRLLDTCSGQIVGCIVTAAGGLAVAKNDYVRVVGLTSSLRTVTDSSASAKDATVRQVTTVYGPFVLGDAIGPMAWGNGSVTQTQETEERSMSSAGGDVPHVGGPVVHGGVSGQMAWGNKESTQHQTRSQLTWNESSDVATVVAQVLQQLGALGLPEDELKDAVAEGQLVLAEVAKEEPDRTVVRRGINYLKGVVAAIATGAVVGVNQGAAEIGQQIVKDLGGLVI
ncbi:right-handed parallel beta-helix repeat-containing protein [Nocardioides sp. NPDC000445]|uniref:right-handed parallel beta-helix repeat-containing protein n=1 Tax=Nocardioides sp. NPDC000445 TaxID=3154257 RepID=UPI00332DFAED